MHVTTRQLDEALTQVNNLLKELYQRVDVFEAKNNGRTFMIHGLVERT